MPPPARPRPDDAHHGDGMLLVGPSSRYELAAARGLDLL